MTGPGLVVAAPRSGAGKTTVTLGLMRALARRGLGVGAAKCGPDYIDPAFHAFASGRESVNLDSWAMPPPLLRALAAGAAQEADIVICEGLMGLFDGVPGEEGRTGSTADIAAMGDWPVLLVLDVSGQSTTAAAVVKGFATYDARIRIGGVVLNRVGSERHRHLVSAAIAKLGIPVLGSLPRSEAVRLPERHLGLVQAAETSGLDALIEAMADFVEGHVDIAGVLEMAGAPPSPARGSRGTDTPRARHASAPPTLTLPTTPPGSISADAGPISGNRGARGEGDHQRWALPSPHAPRFAGQRPCASGKRVGGRGGEGKGGGSLPPASSPQAGEGGALALPPPGRRIALARDAAFSFIYPHLIRGWREAGAEIVPFSPLADEGPAADCDACWLPGGYPELHAGRLAASSRFLDALRDFARTRTVHGECGGYMVLGRALIDAKGESHRMAGLLSVVTSFEKRKMQLGYRDARLLADGPLGVSGTRLSGHEFHYSTVVERGEDAPFAEVSDAYGGAAQPMGGRRDRVSGSFFHAIARIG